MWPLHVQDRWGYGAAKHGTAGGLNDGHLSLIKGGREQKDESQESRETSGELGWKWRALRAVLCAAWIFNVEERSSLINSLPRVSRQGTALATQALSLLLIDMPWQS